MEITKNVRSQVRPEPITAINNNVYVTSNITEYTQVLDENHTIHGYQYDCAKYTLSEYLTYLMEEATASHAAEQEAEIAELKEELAAAKILLGVE